MGEKGEALSLDVPNLSCQNLLPSDLSGPKDSSWFAVQTRPRHEKKVTVALCERGVNNFLPIHRERRRWSDRQQWVDLPMFSQYLFVHVAESSESKVRVLQIPGVVQFVGATGRGTPIPDEQIENLRAIIANGIPLTPHDFLRVGERVRIRGGALEGIEGILSAIKNDKSLVVSVNLIQKSVAIRLDGFEVEPA